MLGIALIAIVLGGCTPSASPDVESNRDASQSEPVPLRLMVVDDTEMAEAIQREWLARAGRELDLREVSETELRDTRTARLGADVIIYPSALLGHLAARDLIQDLDSEDPDKGQAAGQDVFELLRLRETCWSDKRMAVSLGSPQLLLVYRTDLFRDQRLNVPTTWDEYGDLVIRLADLKEQGKLAAGEGNSWHTVIEPLGKGWASQTLMARAAAYAKHRNQFSALFEYRTMKPLIAGPAWVRALKDLQKVSSQFPESATDFTPSDVRAEFLKGNCAIALTWPSRADDLSAAEVEPSSFQAEFAELPGAMEAYNYRSQEWENRGGEEMRQVSLLGVSGRLGSVCRESSQVAEAVNLLDWLSGELSGQISPASRHVTLFRTSHIAHAADWVDIQLQPVAGEYGKTLEKAFSHSDWLSSIRIPGRPQYLTALDHAVHSVLSGDATPEQALATASETWNVITESLGRDQQRAAYMSSIGLRSP